MKEKKGSTVVIIFELSVPPFLPGSAMLFLPHRKQALKTFRRTAHDRGGAHMAGEVEAEMAILTKVVQAKEVLLTHGAAGCLNVSTHTRRVCVYVCVCVLVCLLNCT